MKFKTKLILWQIIQKQLNFLLASIHSHNMESIKVLSFKIKPRQDSRACFNHIKPDVVNEDNVTDIGLRNLYLSRS